MSAWSHPVGVDILPMADGETAPNQLNERGEGSALITAAGERNE